MEMRVVDGAVVGHLTSLSNAGMRLFLRKEANGLPCTVEDTMLCVAV